MRGSRIVCGDGQIYTIVHTIVDFIGFYAVWVVKRGSSYRVIDSRRCRILP
jgi:hypothetical protein